MRVADLTPTDSDLNGLYMQSLLPEYFYEAAFGGAAFGGAAFGRPGF